jgi:hypothetical protein
MQTGQKIKLSDCKNGDRILVGTRGNIIDGNCTGTSDNFFEATYVTSSDGSGYSYILFNYDNLNNINDKHISYFPKIPQHYSQQFKYASWLIDNAYVSLIKRKNEKSIIPALSVLGTSLIFSSLKNKEKLLNVFSSSQ